MIINVSVFFSLLFLCFDNAQGIDLGKADQIIQNRFVTDPNWGTSVALSPASSLVIGSGNGTSQYKYVGLWTSNPEGSNFSVLQEDFPTDSSTYFGVAVAINEDGSSWATTYFNQSQWYWKYSWAFDVQRQEGQIPNCTIPGAQTAVTMGRDAMVVSCDANAYFYRFANRTPITFLSSKPLIPTGDMSMTHAEELNIQVLCGTAANYMTVYTDQQNTSYWEDIANIPIVGSTPSPFAQAASWNGTIFADANADNEIRLYQIIDLTGLSGYFGFASLISPSYPVGDLAVGDGLVAFTLSDVGQVVIHQWFKNRTVAPVPCFTGESPAGRARSMSVSIASQASPNYTIAIGVTPVDTNSDGTVYILHNPCGPNPDYIPTTTATTISTTTAATSATTAQSSTSTVTTTTLTTSTTSIPTTTTTTGGQSTATCLSNVNSVIASQATCNTTTGIWTVPGDVTGTSEIIIKSADTVNINGSLNLTNQASLTVHTNEDRAATAFLSVQGVAQISGPLTIIVDGPINGSVTIAIINATTIQGTFSNVQIIQSNQGKCQKVQAKPLYSNTGVFMQLSTSNSCDNKSTRNKIIIGAVVGGTGALIIISIIIVVILVILKSRGKATSAFWAGSGAHTNDQL